MQQQHVVTVMRGVQRVAAAAVVQRAAAAAVVVRRQARHDHVVAVRGVVVVHVHAVVAVHSGVVRP